MSNILQIDSGNIPFLEHEFQKIGVSYVRKVSSGEEFSVLLGEEQTPWDAIVIEPSIQDDPAWKAYDMFDVLLLITENNQYAMIYVYTNDMDPVTMMDFINFGVDGWILKYKNNPEKLARIISDDLAEQEE